MGKILGQSQITIYDVFDGEKGDTGSQGIQGVQGVRGDDGTTYYTWIKFADSPTTGMSDNPTGKDYMGIAYNKLTPVESTNYSDYAWTKIKGETGERGLTGLQGEKGDQGIAGSDGSDGASSYTHIAYATNSTGTSGFSVSDPVNKTYMGIYVDSIPTDSTDPTKYKWTLIKGAKGDQGVAGQTGADGRTPYFHTAWSNSADGTSGFSTTDSLNKLYIGTYTDFTVNDSTVPSTYKWTKIKGDKGDTGNQGIAGPKGADGVTTYTWVKYADDELGNGMSDSPDGKRYLGLAYNKTVQTESSNKADYSWSPLYDNVQVGGRNLLKLTSFNDPTEYSSSYEISLEGQTGTTTKSIAYAGSGDFDVYEKGTYTISFWMKVTATGVSSVRLSKADLSTPTSFGTINYMGRYKGLNNWEKVVYTFTLDKSYKLGLQIYNHEFTASFDTDVYIKEIKIEQGNIPTDWTPAPEDVKDEVSIIGGKVSDLEEATTPARIIETVVYDEQFTSIMNGKANSEDISDMATGKMLTDSETAQKKYVDGRLDDEGGVISEINKVSSALEKTANDINAKFQSSGGVNLVRNSLGFASDVTGIDFWNIKTAGIETIQNQELEQLGFGSGFYKPLGGSNAYIEQTVNIQPKNADGSLKVHSLSMWLNKKKDNASLGYAVVEVFANSTRILSIGKGTGAGTTEGWELGIGQFTTSFSEITVRIAFGQNCEGIISGLMVNVGEDALQWQHHPQEIYNTNIQMNLNGLKVINGQTKGYTIMSDKEFSGYAEVLDANNNPQMVKVFTLNGATTEVTQLDVDNEIKMGAVTVRMIDTGSNRGWAFIADE